MWAFPLTNSSVGVTPLLSRNTRQSVSLRKSAQHSLKIKQQMRRCLWIKLLGGILFPESFNKKPQQANPPKKIQMYLSIWMDHIKAAEAFLIRPSSVLSFYSQPANFTLRLCSALSSTCCFIASAFSCEQGGNGPATKMSWISMTKKIIQLMKVMPLLPQ